MTVRTVVTGLGIIAPTGVGVDEYWSATLSGKSAIGLVTRFDASKYPVQLCGEVTNLDPTQHLPNRLLPQTDHVTRLSLVASERAFADAGVDLADVPEFEMGVVTASAAGGFEFGQRELQKLWSRGSAFVSAYQSFAWFYAVNTGQISIRHGMRGPSGVLVSEQAGGLDAVAQARRHLDQGARLMITGAVDSNICPWGWIAQIKGGRSSTSIDPARAYLPFGAAANGHVSGEGGALLVLETLDAARRRGVDRPYGEVVGYGATFDPAPDTGRPATLAKAIDRALADARIGPDEVDIVLADGAAVPELDLVEAQAMASIFGPYGVPISVPKAGTGRLAAGGGALDLATALLCLRDQVVPPTPNVEAPAADYPIDLVVGQPREMTIRTALVVARGYGGFNVAMVLRR